MKPQHPKPSGWPKEFAFTDNPWFNAWRPRPSDAGRMTACLAWTCLPRDNAFTFAKDGVSQTAEEKLVEVGEYTRAVPMYMVVRLKDAE